MSKKAEVNMPEVPELERQRKVIDSGHNTAISDLLEWLLAIAGVLGAHDTSVSEIDINRLGELMPEELWDGRKTILRKFWRFMSEKDKDLQRESKEAGRGIHDIRIFDVRIADVLNEFFGLDPNKIENERREILAGLRAGHELDDQRKQLGVANDGRGETASESVFDV